MSTSSDHFSHPGIATGVAHLCLCGWIITFELNDLWHRYFAAGSFWHYRRCTVKAKDTPPFSALTLLVGQQEGHPACKKTDWWGSGVVICLERGADLHMAQLMPLPLTVSCFSKIQIGFTFLVPAHPGNPGKRAVKRVCVLWRPKSSVRVQVNKLHMYA